MPEEKSTVKSTSTTEKAKTGGQGSKNDGVLSGELLYVIIGAPLGVILILIIFVIAFCCVK